MPEIRWEFYPLVAQHELARTWLTMQRNLQLAPATIDAYGRNLNDYLAFCSKHSLLPETPDARSAGALRARSCLSSQSQKPQDWSPLALDMGSRVPPCNSESPGFASTMIISSKNRFVQITPLAEGAMLPEKA